MTQKTKNSSQNTIYYLIGGSVAIAVLVFAVIFFQSNTNSSNLDYSNIPQNRTDDGAFVLGNPDAPVTVVAFEDFLCPACQGYQPEIHEFIEEYVATGQAKFEYRALPAVDPTYSAIAHQLAECSVEQDVSFWEAHDTLFNIASTSRFNNSSAREFADRLGLSYGELLNCQEDATQYRTDQALAQQIGVTGTPTVGIRIDGSDIRLGLVSQRPSVSELGAVIENYQ